ncbi:regulator of G-protein signaling 2-like [Ciona intestinalis]
MAEKEIEELQGAFGKYRKISYSNIQAKAKETSKEKKSTTVKLRKEQNSLTTSKQDTNHRSAPQLLKLFNEKPIGGENTHRSPRRQRPKSLFFGNQGTSIMRRPRPASIPSYTLADVLDNKKLRMSFKNFLESEFSSENLEFWCSCEQYRKVKRTAQRGQDAETIYQTFVSPMSENQVNIDHVTRRQITLALTSGDPLPCNVFDNAQRYIYSIMENDSFPRFILSSHFKEASKKKSSLELLFGNLLPNKTPSPRTSSKNSENDNSNNGYVLRLQNPTKFT